MTLCALSDVKTMLDIAVSDTTKDTKLNLMIKQVSARIVNFIGYPVARATHTEEVRCVNNRQLIELRACPIQSVSAVSIAGVAITDYVILPEYAKFGMLYRGSGWVGNYYTRDMTYDPVSGFWDIKVTYDAGWYLPGDVDYTEGDEDSLPLDIQNAAMQAVIEWYRVNSSGSEGLKSHSEGGISDTWATTDPAHNPSRGLSLGVCQMLEPYQRKGIA